jgi:cbb3-type cytochrome oxidase subunit 1
MAMSKAFIIIAVGYLIVGGCLGFFMGITQNFTLIPVHAHILLAGWASLAVMGLIYNQYPRSATTRLAKLHFWLHNIGLPIFMGGLALQLTGHPVPVALVAGATAFLVGLIVFAVNVWLTVGHRENAS